MDSSSKERQKFVLSPPRRLMLLCFLFVISKNVMNILHFHLELCKGMHTFSTNAKELNETSVTGKEQTMATIHERMPNMATSLRILLGTAFHDAPVLPSDEKIDHDAEKRRCKQYGWTFTNRTRRRKIFWGSLIAEDSWHVIGISAMEYYGIIDSIVFVESNTTQSLTSRRMRFGPHNESHLQALQSPLLWGPNTKVVVDYYYDPEGEARKALLREDLQRDVILRKWKDLGMKEDDIGLLSDADEVATRDFLRALQICNVPQFHDRGHNNCKTAKIQASSLVFESTPSCLVLERRWHHPDFIIGKCVDGIGEPTLHEPAARRQKYGQMRRVDGWWNQSTKLGFPLWQATDFRAEGHGAEMKCGQNKLHTAFHIHNFFDTISHLRNKYKTYGHPVKDTERKHLEEISSDIHLMTDCIMNRTEMGNKRRRVDGGWKSVPPLRLPVAFISAPSYPEARDRELQQMVEEDEQNHAGEQKE